MRCGSRGIETIQALQEYRSSAAALLSRSCVACRVLTEKEFPFSACKPPHNLDSSFPCRARAHRSRIATTAAQSTTSVLTRNTTPNLDPLATRPSAGLASPRERSTCATGSNGLALPCAPASFRCCHCLCFVFWQIWLDGWLFTWTGRVEQSHWRISKPLLARKEIYRIAK